MIHSLDPCPKCKVKYGELIKDRNLLEKLAVQRDILLREAYKKIRQLEKEKDALIVKNINWNIIPSDHNKKTP